MAGLEVSTSALLQPSSAGAESLRFKLHNSRKMLLQPGFYYDYDCDYDCD